MDQPVEAIVNAWNRNFIPWWLLLPQGVSRAIKRRGGYAPFKELAKKGIMPLGGAVLTGAGRLPFKGIIHVAGLNWFWRSSSTAVERSVYSAVEIINQEGFNSAAFPLIGAGTGGLGQEQVRDLMLETFEKCDFKAKIVISVLNDLEPMQTAP